MIIDYIMIMCNIVYCIHCLKGYKFILLFCQIICKGDVVVELCSLKVCVKISSCKQDITLLYLKGCHGLYSRQVRKGNKFPFSEQRGLCYGHCYNWQLKRRNCPGHLLASAEAKKMKLLTLHNPGRTSNFSIKGLLL